MSKKSKAKGKTLKLVLRDSHLRCYILRASPSEALQALRVTPVTPVTPPKSYVTPPMSLALRVPLRHYILRASDIGGVTGVTRNACNAYNVPSSQNVTLQKETESQ